MEKCPHCGQEIEELTVRCTYCGLYLKSEDDITYDADSMPKGSAKRDEDNDLSWATSIVIFIIIMIAFFLFKTTASAISRHFEKNIGSELKNPVQNIELYQNR